MSSSSQGEKAPVSAVELFFDLVFVFTLTQQTHLIEHAHGALEYFRAFLILTLVWYIFAGFTWLTNGVGTQKNMRFALISGMGGFLVMALSIPRVFEDGGLVFSLSYAFVVLVHLLAFAFGNGGRARSAMIKIVPFNIGASALIVIAALLNAEYRWIPLLAAVLWLSASYLFLNSGNVPFKIRPAHFVERHGLVFIIALGESILGLGAGVDGQRIDTQIIAIAILSLAVVAAIWWIYFNGDEERIEHIMQRLPDKERETFANNFWTVHLIMITGIILLAAGLKTAFVHEGQSGSLRLVTLGAGVFLAGSLASRLLAGIRPILYRGCGTLAAMFLVYFGFQWGHLTELVVTTGLLTGLVVLEKVTPVSIHLKRSKR